MGEFSVEVEGTGSLPSIMDTFTVASFSDTTSSVDLIIPVKNKMIEQMRQENLSFEKILSQVAPFTGEDLTYKTESSSSYFTLPREITLVWESGEEKKGFIKDRASSPMYGSPSSVSPSTPQGGRGGKGGSGTGSGGSGGVVATGSSSTFSSGVDTPITFSSLSQPITTTKIPIQFHAKTPGEYSSHLLLHSPLDLRVYEI